MTATIYRSLCWWASYVATSAMLTRFSSHKHEGRLTQQQCVVALAALNTTMHCACESRAQWNETMWHRLTIQPDSVTFDLWPLCPKIGCQLHDRGNIFPPNLKFLRSSKDPAWARKERTDGQQDGQHHSWPLRNTVPYGECRIIIIIAILQMITQKRWFL